MNRKAKLISVSIEKGEADLLFATSPEMKSLFIFGRGEEEMKINITTAIKNVYAAIHKDVEVFEVENSQCMEKWVIIEK